jgi:hypothetical protein
LLKNLLLKRLKPILDEKQIIPTHQSGFRNKHSTIDQMHRIITIIEETLEEKNSAPLSSWTWPKLSIKLDMKDSFPKLSSSYQQNTANC